MYYPASSLVFYKPDVTPADPRLVIKWLKLQGTPPRYIIIRYFATEANDTYPIKKHHLLALLNYCEVNKIIAYQYIKDGDGWRAVSAGYIRGFGDINRSERIDVI